MTALSARRHLLLDRRARIERLGRDADGTALGSQLLGIEPGARALPEERRQLQHAVVPPRGKASVCPGYRPQHGVMQGLLTHVADWRAQLDWVRDAGVDGAIVFESADAGAEQDQLRRDGFAVIGDSALGDRLENDRAFGQAALAEAGMTTAATHTFCDFEQAIAFIREHPRRYVFKLNGSALSSWRN